MPSRVSSCRIGPTIISSYIVWVLQGLDHTSHPLLPATRDGASGTPASRRLAGRRLGAPHRVEMAARRRQASRRGRRRSSAHQCAFLASSTLSDDSIELSTLLYCDDSASGVT